MVMSTADLDDGTSNRLTLKPLFRSKSSAAGWVVSWQIQDGEKVQGCVPKIVFVIIAEEQFAHLMKTFKIEV